MKKFIMNDASWKGLLRMGSPFLAGLTFSMASVADLDIPDTPLFLTSVGVRPNIVLTLDDSGSMRRAFVPELCGDSSDCSDLDNRWAKSSHANALYYDPTATYDPPLNADGTSRSTSFTEAWRNGFYTSSRIGGVNFQQTLDLTEDYRPTAYLDMEVYPAERFADHYSSDVRCGSGKCQYNRNLGSGLADWVYMESNAWGSLSCTHDYQCEDEGMPAYYYVFDENNSGCAGTAAEKKRDNDCYDIRIVSSTSGADRNGDGVVEAAEADERQNFADWYSFYRTRNLATVSAAALAFGALDDESRVAWQALNSCRGSTTTLTTSSCDGWTGTYGANAIGYLSGTKRSNFYDWLARVPTSGGTRLRQAMVRAGEYYEQSTPYNNDLGGGATDQYSCRKNYHVMMTDGIWNDSDSSITLTNSNADNTAIAHLPDEGDENPIDTSGTPYDPSASYASPYQDIYSKTLADVAFDYWSKDLRTGLDDNVPQHLTVTSGTDVENFWNPRNDPATWQHMVNYTIGLGLTDFLADAGLTWGGDTYSGSYTAIASGGEDWPEADASMGSGSSADYGRSSHDLWHAAINSRGQFYSSEGPDQLVEAFQDIVDTINAIVTSGGGAGLGSNTTKTFLEEDETGEIVVFEAKFNNDWSGQLFAQPVDIFTGGPAIPPYWDAGQLIPAASQRNVFTLNGTAQELTSSSCTGVLATALNQNADGVVDDLCTERINWLRGDGQVTGAVSVSYDAATSLVTAEFTVVGHGFQTGDRVRISGVEVQDPADPGYNGIFEITVTSDDTFTAEISSAQPDLGTYAVSDPDDDPVRDRASYAQFRDRPNSVLGDIINSDPVYASEDDFGYGDGSSAVTGSGTYGNFLTAKGSVPPMIYAGANDGMLHGFRADTGNTDSGVEQLAYVPNGVYDHLSALTDPGYTHRFYVDGPLSIRDAFLGASWGTYLVGGLGAGGKSVFALDITDPEGFSEDDVLWEFEDSDDLGLTYGRPQIAAITVSQWAAIFSNGYNIGDPTTGTDDQAYLFVVDLATGAQLAKIATNSDPDNGLSTPYLYDSDGDKIIDVAYAGDLQGNLWKFVNDAGTWSLGNGGAPLFTARNDANDVQPITSEPKVAAHPDGGVLVYFGTGSYLSTDDLTNDDVQSFYAIWDKGAGNQATVTRDDLAGYSVLTEQSAFGFTVRTTSEGTVDWGTQWGWYLDLPATAGVPSERIVATPLVLEFTDDNVPDRVLFVTNTLAADPCSRGGTTWLFELDLITGGRTATSVFDLTGEGEFTEDDTLDGGVTVSAIALPEEYGLTGEPLLLKNVEGDLIKLFSGSTGVSGTAGVPLQQGELPAAPGNLERIYWRQIL